MERLRNCGGSLTIPCQGSLIVPSGNIDTFPLINEFNLDPRRLTTAQSPLGGVNGLVDYAPGSVHVTDGDGIYLTDVAGNNTSKDLPAGLLSRLGYLTVDTVAHTITEEFIVANTATSNNPTVIDACDATTGWTLLSGTATITVESNTLKCSGTASALSMLIYKSVNLNLSTSKFICFDVKGSVADGYMYCRIRSANGSVIWNRATATIGTNFTRFILPLDAPAGSSGLYPFTRDAGFDKSAVTYIYVGISGGISSGAEYTLYLDNITADVAKPAYIETAVPDNITSVVYQKWTGSTYETNCIANMDSVYSTTFLDSAKMVLNDGTKFDDVYGSGNGISRFVKGASGQTVNGSLAGTQMTYSAVKGTKHRIGFRVDLPPSDGGRTAFNQCRIKKIIYYSDVNKASNILPDISGNGNNRVMSSVGLTTDNLGNPYGAMLFDGARSYVNCGNGSNYNINNEITLVSWVKVNQFVSNSQDPIIVKLNSVDPAQSTAYGLTLGYGSNRTCFVSYTAGNAGGATVSGSSTLLVGLWYRLIATYNGATSTANIYINGILDTTSNTILNGNIRTSAGNLYLGNGAQLSLNGCTKDMRIYSRAWSQAEVTADYSNQPVDPTGLVAQWQPSTVSHMGQSTQEFSNDNNASTGLLNIAKPWLAIIDPTTKIVNYYLFTERPTSLNYKRDESGEVYEVVVNPGNGLVFKGSTIWANDILDSNSDSKPDMLDATIQNSIAQMLSVYGFNR